MSGDPAHGHALFDGIIVQVHQKATGQEGGHRLRPSGIRAGGLTTRIVALVVALGNPLRFLLLPGRAQDMKGVAPLIKGVSFDALPADKTCDADWLLQDLDGRGATAVIPPKANCNSSEIMTRSYANGGIWWRITSQK